MNTSRLKLICGATLLISGMLATSTALAEKPSWAGGGKHGNQQDDRREHFKDRHRVLVRDYYDDRFQKGRCPPGLAKKHTGCMPPGQAKNWQVGQQLPRDATYYSVPRNLAIQIGQPPSGYRYVRVASDILMVNTVSRMVVDAIRGLGHG